MIKVKNVDPSIEFLWVGSQLTPGMGRVAADPGVGSQLIPVPIRVMKIGRDGNPVLSDTYLGGGFKYFLCSPLFEEDSHVETTNQLLCIGVS